MGGYLEKMGSGMLKKKWQRYWCVLFRGCVAFYKSPEAAARERKAIDVWQQVVEVRSPMANGGAKSSKDKDSLIFVITVLGKKDAQVAVSLKAHDTTTRNEWVDALQKCNRASRVAHESAQVSAKLAMQGKGSVASLMLEGIEIGEVFEKHSLLGEGSCAKVHAMRHRGTGDIVAVKSISKRRFLTTERAVTTTRREIDIMKEISTTLLPHPNIVRLEAVVESMDYIHLVMEYVKGCDLAEDVMVRGAYSEDRAADVLRQLGSALAFLHENSIVHRDLKPENILVATRGDNIPVVKLADFGLSNIMGDGETDMLKSKCGTMLYMAPEMMQRHPYCTKVDVWSAGVILYIMLSGNLPFYAETPEDFLDIVLEDVVEFPEQEWTGISGAEAGGAQNLVCAMLEVSTERRPSFTEVLRHEWLASKAAPEADEAGDASATEAKLRELEGELEGEELADELREAEALYRRALAINEAEHGPRHPSTQKSATGLWNVLDAKGGCEAEVAALRAAHGI